MTEPSALDRCLSDPGYTPPRKELGALVRSLAELGPEQALRVERCLHSAGFPAAEAARNALAGASEKLRIHAYSLLSRFASEGPPPALFEWLSAGLSDDSERCRRAAASALGKLGDERAEPLLLAALEGAPLELSRVVVEALGKIGGAKSKTALDSLSTSDAELERRRKRASLLLSRRLQRDQTSTLRLDRPLPTRTRIRFECRSGLLDLLAQELSAFGPRERSPTALEIEHAGSLNELLRARTALHFGIVVKLTSKDERVEVRVADALASRETVAALSAWTDGALRLRFEFRDAGHQRALAWRIAEQLSLREPRLVNDPREPTFTVHVALSPEEELLIVPRFAQDPRFAFRKRDVPAASHPTIAAALALTAGVFASDVVWDPFVGSGLELIERARLGPYARLIGSDLEPRALAAARENLESAGVDRFELLHADALACAPRGVTLILTNPPMGRRVARDGSIGKLLEDFVFHATRVLSSGGRLVWLSVLDRRTERAARSAGFDVTAGPELDLGGFSARIQVLFRR
jgi:predicted RNA methylase